MSDVASPRSAKGTDRPAGGASASPRYLATKRAFDVIVSIVLLAPLAMVALTLLVLNPFFNAGPLLFVQDRMGLGGSRFRAFKFRSMTGADEGTRGAFDLVESHRITTLGRILRRTRLDELPQVLNVLRGEMSLIGPRPDVWEHACVYAETVPGYRERHAMLPGISGYAQVHVGYVQDIDALRSKVSADLHYLRHASLALDLRITLRTLLVVCGARGL